MNEEIINKKICKKCGNDKFTTYENILICSQCAYPKTKRGYEKLLNLSDLPKFKSWRFLKNE